VTCSIARSLSFLHIHRIHAGVAVADKGTSSRAIRILEPSIVVRDRREKAIISQWEVGVGMVADGGPMPGCLDSLAETAPSRCF